MSVLLALAFIWLALLVGFIIGWVIGYTVGYLDARTLDRRVEGQRQAAREGRQ